MNTMARTSSQTAPQRNGETRRSSPPRPLKFGQDAFGSRVWRIFRDAVEEQTARRAAKLGGWNGARAAIAKAINVPPRSFEKQLTGTDPLMPSLAGFMRLLCSETALEPEVRDAMVAELCREWGYEPPARLLSGRTGEDLVRAQMDAAAAAGRFAQVVSKATDPDSERGAEISDNERGEVLRAATGLSRAAAAGRVAVGEGRH